MQNDSSASVPTSTEMPLRDAVLAILSLSAQQGYTEVPTSQFYELFAKLTERFPSTFPGLGFVKSPLVVYSKRLDDALNELCWSIKIMQKHSGECMVTMPDAAARHLLRLQRRFGASAIKALRPVSNHFVACLSSAS